MEGLSYDCLPVILVSAKDNGAASTIISEIIDNESTEVYKETEDLVKRDRVWRIVNKYYTADVKLRPIADDELSSEVDDVEAHVIYLTEEEVSSPAAVVRRRAAVAPRAHTRLVVAAGAVTSPALLSAAGAARAELVLLTADDDDDDDSSSCGVSRVREALQAHAWRGRRRAEGREEAPAAGDESFFAALASLPAAARAARGAAGAGDDNDRELRLERAEALVTAFCRALGHDTDDW